MVDLSNLRLLTSELDTSFAKSILHPMLPSIKLDMFKIIIDQIDNYVIVVDTKLKIIMVNKKAQELITNTLGKPVYAGDDWYKTIFGLNETPDWDPLKKALQTRKVVMKTVICQKTGCKYCTLNIPIIYNGTSGVVGIGVEDFNGK